MKNRTVYILLTVTMLASTAGLTGCERLVHSAVVAEKDSADGKTVEAKVAGETKTTGATKTSGSNKSGQTDTLIQKTVPEQVDAPSKYERTITATLSSVKQEGQDTKFTLTADAPVEVPDVDAITLKKVERTVMDQEQIDNVVQVLAQGQTLEKRAEQEDSDEMENWNVTVDGIPYFINAYDSGFGLWFDAAEGPDGSLEAYEDWCLDILKKAETGKTEDTRKAAEKLVDELGIRNFQIVEGVNKGYPLLETKPDEKMDYYHFERLVDGVPVTYVNEQALPMYPGVMVDYNETDGTWKKAPDEAWLQENLEVDFLSGALWMLVYGGPLRIADLSDESQFLLPFSEIQEIFETNISYQLTMEDNPYRMSAYDGTAMYRYPAPGSRTVDMHIDKVRLGYMRTRDEGSDTEGTLIPVWDFFGTWTAEEPDEDGSGFTDSTMNSQAVPMLTIDARDGSVVQRLQCY